MQPENQKAETASSSTESSIFDMSEFDSRAYGKHIRNARITLYVLAVFQLIALFALPSRMDELAKYITIAISVAFSAFFTVCALYTRKKPLVAITTALIVYIAMLVIQFLLSPASIISPRLLIQCAIIVVLSLGIQNARELERERKSYGG